MSEKLNLTKSLKLFDEAKKLLNQIIKEKWFDPKATIGCCYYREKIARTPGGGTRRAGKSGSPQPLDL